jgi:hypothetical protein
VLPHAQKSQVNLLDQVWHVGRSMPQSRSNEAPQTLAVLTFEVRDELFSIG